MISSRMTHSARSRCACDGLSAETAAETACPANCPQRSTRQRRHCPRRRKRAVPRAARACGSRMAPRACRSTSRACSPRAWTVSHSESRAVLEAASIVGRDFRPGAVAALLEEGGARSARRARSARAPRNPGVRRRGQLGRSARHRRVSRACSAAPPASLPSRAPFTTPSSRRMPKTRPAPALHERFAARLAQREGHEPALVGSSPGAGRALLRTRAASECRAAAGRRSRSAGRARTGRSAGSRTRRCTGGQANYSGAPASCCPRTSAHRGDIEIALERSRARRIDRKRD